MTEQYVIGLVPSKVRSVLDCIDKLLEDSKNKNIVLIFSHELIDGSDNCVFKIIQNNKSTQFKIGIISEYDYIFYSQLLISILDNYSNNKLVELSSVYNNNEKFNYSLCFLYDNNGKISIYIDAVNDLKKVVEYYNEQLVLKKNDTKFRTVGGR